MIGVSNWGKQVAMEESNPKEAVCEVEKGGKDSALPPPGRYQRWEHFYVVSCSHYNRAAVSCFQ